jgi:acetolactate synthase-1/2/3 large subunit
MFQPDFVKIAEAMGVTGLSVSDKAQVESSIEAALAHPGAVLIDFQVEDVEDCYPMMPPGVSLSDTIDQPPVESKQPEMAR